MSIKTTETNRKYIFNNLFALVDAHNEPVIVTLENAGSELVRLARGTVHVRLITTKAYCGSICGDVDLSTYYGGRVDAAIHDWSMRPMPVATASDDLGAMVPLLRAVRAQLEALISDVDTVGLLASA